MLKFIFGILTLGISSILVAEQVQFNPKEESSYISARGEKSDVKGSGSRGSSKGSIGKQRSGRSTSSRGSSRVRSSGRSERRSTEMRRSRHFERRGDRDRHWKGGHRGRDAWHRGNWGWYWGPNVIFYFDTTPTYYEYCEEIYLDAATGAQVYIDVGPVPSQEIMIYYIRAVRCGDAIYILDW